MEKQLLPILILLVIVVVAWIGISVYSTDQNLDINPNAGSFTRNINPRFDLTGFNDVKNRISELPVSPTSFTSLSTSAESE